MNELDKNNADVEIEQENVNAHDQFMEQDSLLTEENKDVEIASELNSTVYHGESNKAKNIDLGIEKNRTLGWIALVITIISLFIMPVILGVTGLVLGFIGRLKGAEWLGTTAMSLAIVSLVLQLFVFPFM